MRSTSLHALSQVRQPQSAGREPLFELWHRLYRSSDHDQLGSDTNFKLLLVVVVLVALYFVVRWLAAPAEFPALPPAQPMR